MMMLPDGFLLCSKQNSSKIIMNLVNLQPMGPACKAKNTEYKNEYYFLCQNNYKQPPKTSMMPLLHNNQDPKIFFFANNQPALTILIAWPQKKLLLNLGTFFLNFFFRSHPANNTPFLQNQHPQRLEKNICCQQPAYIYHIDRLSMKRNYFGPWKYFFLFFLWPWIPLKVTFWRGKNPKGPQRQ